MQTVECRPSQFSAATQWQWVGYSFVLVLRLQLSVVEQKQYHCLCIGILISAHDFFTVRSGMMMHLHHGKWLHDFRRACKVSQARSGGRYRAPLPAPLLTGTPPEGQNAEGAQRRGGK